MERIIWMEKYMAEAESMIVDGQVERGIATLSELLFDEPGYGSLHNYLGWAHMYYTREFSQAELHFRMAIKFSPEYAPPFLHMGNLMNQRGRYSEAIEFFRSGLEKSEAIRSTLFEGIAYAHEMKGEYRQAIRAYKEAARECAIDFELDRLMKGVKRCRRKRVAFFFTF